MNMKIRNLLMLASALLMLAACNPKEDLSYMTNIDQIPSAALSAAATQAGDFTIKRGDLLAINVSASNADAVRPFNKQQYIPTLGTGQTYGFDYSTVYYLVDDNGNIDFPILGKLHVIGMSKSSLQDHIANLIYPKYLTEKPDIECRIQNFRVFCLGEFNSPGVINASNGRLNLIEAIAMCHDLKNEGRRDNVMLIRTNQNGERYAKRIDLNDATFMTMPEFDLQQNDIIYVEPNKYKKRSIWSLPPVYNAAVSIFGTGVSVVNFILLLAK